LSTIIGIDEAGRGPLAGPVVAAAVCIPKKFNTSGITDSKKVSPKKREELYLRIMKECQVGIGIINPEEIDNSNILKATLQAMKLACEKLAICYDLALVDGNQCPEIKNCRCIIKGDEKFIQISAASIIAKVYRDRIMNDLAIQFPNYDFEKHKGYGTSSHVKALNVYGPIEGVHRFSFSPVRKLLI